MLQILMTVTLPSATQISLQAPGLLWPATVPHDPSEPKHLNRTCKPGHQPHNMHKLLGVANMQRDPRPRNMYTAPKAFCAVEGSKKSGLRPVTSSNFQFPRLHAPRPATQAQT